MMPKRRIETRASRTAAYTCFARGCATREKDPRFRGPDYLAEVMFPPLARLSLNVPALRKFLMQQMFPPGIYEYTLARTKVMDEEFLDALQNGFQQIVLLGAGFDTRALRFADRNRGTKVIELDVPATQQPKIKILRRKNLGLPEELIFASIDFDREDICEVLWKAGYEPGRKSLFLWEGVTMYLSAKAVDHTLEFIRMSAAPGSHVVFDYIYASVLRRENRYYGEQGLFATVSRTGEGWTFGLEEGVIETFLSERGFDLIAHYTPRELEWRYLTADNGTLHGRVNGTHCIVIASLRG
jgi:methyltransferase (TIGR00027 family)